MSKKMGSLGKLSQFSGIRPKKEPIETSVVVVPEEAPSQSPPKTQVTVKDRERSDEKLVTVNIKVLKTQRDWLADKASQVRDNNIQPVPSKERVYPQHLIGVAIALLQSADVDWEQVQDIEDLREQLEL